MKALRFLLIIVCAYFLASCVSTKQADSNSNLDRARQTLDSLYLNYSVSNSHLLRENYPSTNNIKSLIWHRKTKQTCLISSPIYGHIQVHFPQ